MAILLPDRMDVATFGEFLREARERRGLTLHQIASETRIPWRHLDALEHGNLDAVPEGVYRRAEIRAYADAVGLDRSLALTQFEHAMESSAAAPNTVAETPAQSSRMSTVWTALGALGVVAAATMFAVSLRSNDRPDTAATPSAPAAQIAPAVTPAAPSLPQTPAPPPEGAAVRAATQAPAAATEVPAVSAASAAPVDVALTITSDPPGARVMVDGIGRGATPLTIDNLAAGSTRVRVIKDGFVSQEREIRIGGRAATRLHLRLDAVH